MKFVRVYTGDDGQSHFEALDAEEGAAIFSNAQSARVVVFKNDQAGHLLDWHPAPRRQYCITLSGCVEIRIGDGSVETLGPGDVLLAEDVTGQGHTLARKSEENWVRAFIHLD